MDTAVRPAQPQEGSSQGLNGGGRGRTPPERIIQHGERRKNWLT